MKKSLWIKTILVLAALTGSAAANIIWPGDGEWNAIMQGTDFYYDPVDTTPAAIDLVGTVDTYSAG